jgi:hypothetical protein
MPQGAYRLFLIAPADNGHGAADLGGVIVDARGRNDSRFQFNRDDIAGSGIAIENIRAACIAQMDEINGQWDFEVFLTGFTGQPFIWRQNLHFPQRSENITQKEPPPPMTVTEAITEAVPEPSYAEDPLIEVPIIKEIPIPKQDHNTICGLFSTRNLVDIFPMEQPKADWIAANLDDLKSLNLHKDDFVVQNVKKYRHALSGRITHEGDRVYILGIPDIYEKNYCPRYRG